jgi:hypothetical protein
VAYLFEASLIRRAWAGDMDPIMKIQEIDPRKK